MRDFLPLGSVVSLKNAKKKILIIGRFQICEGKPYKYSGVLYPDGFLGADNLFIFNEADIANVDFVGFKNEEEEQYTEALKEYIESHRP